MTRAWVSGALLAALWTALGILLFLFAPGLSRLPLAWGAAAGLGALALQILLGERLLRALLRLQPPGPGQEGVDSWIDEERPYLSALGAKPELVATRGFLERSAADLADLSRALRLARTGLPGALLTRTLALPCLLRAFETAVSHYGRLRGGAGPLWFLGRLLGGLAGFLEAPLRLLALPAARPEEPARQRLLEALARYPEFPTWMEALDLLAPVSLAEVRRQAHVAALRGAASPEGWVPPSDLDPAARWAPWAGLALGLGLALLPGGPLAAPLVFLACGLALRAFRELPLGTVRQGEPEALWREAREQGRGLPVRLAGTLIERPEGLAVASGPWLECGQARLLLREAPPGASGTVEVTGWMRPGTPEVLVGTLLAGGRRRRSLPLLRRLLFPAGLLLFGGAWWLLQGVGV